MNNKNKKWARIEYSQIKGQEFPNPLLANLKDKIEFRIYNSHPVVLLQHCSLQTSYKNKETLVSLLVLQYFKKSALRKRIDLTFGWNEYACLTRELFAKLLC